MSSGRLRLMRSGELARVLNWRNHPDVRRFMYTSHEISPEEHEQWFARNNETPGVWLLIYEIDKVPLGFVNISSTRCAEVADWGFYLAPDSEPGTGRSLGEAALTYAFEELELHKLWKLRGEGQFFEPTGSDRVSGARGLHLQFLAVLGYTFLSLFGPGPV